MLSTRQQILTVLAFLLTLISCKKDEDTQAPVIHISSPTTNQSFQVFHDIPVVAQISDDRTLTEVNIQLLDANDNYALDSRSISPGSSQFSLNELYPIGSIHLESGFYHLQVSASDGNNVTRSSVTVYILAVPKVLNKLFVTTANTSTQTNLSVLDTNYSGLSLAHVFSGDHLSGSSSSYYQQVFHAGHFTGAFTSIGSSDYTAHFSFPASVSVNPYFTGYLGEEKKIFLSYFNGNIRGYDPNGSIFYTASANSGYYAKQFCFNGGQLIAEEKQQSGGSSNLLVTFFSTGSPYQQTALSQDVVQFCEMDPDHVLVFGNQGGQAVLQQFDRLNNNLWNPYPSSLPTGTLNCAVRLDSNNYLLGLSNGTIYLYQYLTSSLTTYVSGYTANQLVVDSLNNELIVVESHRITSIPLGSTAAHRSISLPSDSVLHVDLLYNR